MRQRLFADNPAVSGLFTSWDYSFLLRKENVTAFLQGLNLICLPIIYFFVAVSREITCMVNLELNETLKEVVISRSEVFTLWRQSSWHHLRDMFDSLSSGGFCFTSRRSRFASFAEMTPHEYELVIKFCMCCVFTFHFLFHCHVTVCFPKFVWY